MASPNRKQSERVGIWTVAIIIVIAAIWAVIRFVPSVAPANPSASVGAVTASDHVKGKGKVTVIEYADFQCPACKAYEPIMTQLEGNYSDRVQFVYRYFPLTQVHPNAEVAAYAAEAAGRQGKFWEMHDKLYDGQDSWASERDPEVVFEQYAKDLNLNLDQFKKDETSSDVKARVQSDMDAGTAAGINATPTFYLNGQYLQEPQSYDDFKAALDNALKS